MKGKHMREKTASEMAVLATPEGKLGYDNYQLLNQVGRLLREMRREAGLSQQTLQELSGVDQAEISRSESATMGRGPSLITIARMAHAAGYSVTLGVRKRGEAGAIALSAEL